MKHADGWIGRNLFALQALSTQKSLNPDTYQSCISISGLLNS